MFTSGELDEEDEELKRKKRLNSYDVSGIA